MVTDRTEEEQVEALKKWWDDNGTQLLVGIVVVLAGVFGYRTWESNTQLAAEAAVQAGLHAYDRRHGYRGAIEHYELDSILNSEQVAEASVSGGKTQSLETITINFNN